MSTRKKNPNDLQTKEAKTTRPGSIKKAQDKEYQENNKSKRKEDGRKSL